MAKFEPRKFKFKAWNSKDKLLMKLGSIDCVKGELFKKDHILLQYTGMVDKHAEEIYEMDILLLSDRKFLVQWNEQENRWKIMPLPISNSTESLAKETAVQMKRLCSYFELEVS